MKPLSEFSESAVSAAILEVVDDLVFPVKQPGEFTVFEFMGAVEAERGVDLTYAQAAYRLRQMVLEGRLLKGWRLSEGDGKRVLCFWQPSEDPGEPQTP